MKIALASPRVATSLDDGLARVERLIKEAAAAETAVVCFPEAYLPGLRGVDIDVLPFDQATHDHVLQKVSQWAKTYGIMTIMGLERPTPAGRQIAAYVIDAQGQLQGYQAKTQIAPSEDPFYVPGKTRQLFAVNGIKFGIAICHEGWRYPETVRWAARQGAQIVFHPYHTGSDHQGPELKNWGEANAPYYEKAMVMRSIENTIYFASVNYALRYQESATCVIGPEGECLAFLPYGTEGILVVELNLPRATGLIANRYAPERYPEVV